MLYAVTIEPLNGIYFVSERPNGDEWDVEEGVSLDLPSTYIAATKGPEPPEQALCRSTADHKHYALFVNRRDVDPARFQPVGRHFGGLFSKSSWERFASGVLAARKFLEIPDDEPPEATERAVAAIKRGG